MNPQINKNTSAFINSLRGHGEVESLFDYIPDIVFFLKDKERRLVGGNDALIKLLGENSFDNIYGKTGYDYFPKNIADAFDEDDCFVIENKSPIIDRIELLINEHGHIVWHCTTKLPLYAKNGRVIGLKGYTRQIKEAEKIAHPFKDLQPVIEYIRQNIHRVVEVEKLVAISQLSESQFRRKFKQVFRLSPIKLILKLRIMKACGLLRSSALTISEISDLCGFENQNYFSRYFRQQMGGAPREYRKRYTEAS